jgi:hypothetical protein
MRNDKKENEEEETYNSSHISDDKLDFSGFCNLWVVIPYEQTQQLFSFILLEPNLL